MNGMLLVEDSPAESRLACIAIALRRPDTTVYESYDIAHALTVIENERPTLAILGWRALRDEPERLAENVVAVGLAAGLTEADKERARSAGVRAVYDRPNDWERYCDTVESILREWLP
jgi:hypothetical protein